MEADRPNRPSPATENRQEELPSGAAHLRIRLTKTEVEASLSVPPTQAPDLLRLVTRLTGLIVVAVICPLITLYLAGHILSPGWIAFLLTAEIAAGITAAILLYRSRT